MSQHGQVARLQGSPAGAEPSLAELLDPVALEARLVEARARRLEAIARRKAAADSGPTPSDDPAPGARATAVTPVRPVPIRPETADPAPDAGPSGMARPADATPVAREIRRAAQDDASPALPLRRPVADPALRGGPERPAPPRVAQARVAQARVQAAQPAGLRAVPPAEPGPQPAARLPLPAPPPRIGPADPRTSPGRPTDRRPMQPLHAPARAVQAPSPGPATAGRGRSALMLGATFAAGMAGAVAALVFGPPVMRSWMTEQSAPVAPPVSPAATAAAPAVAPGVETTSIRAPDPVTANRAGAAREPSRATATGDVPIGPLARTTGAPAAGDAAPLGPILPRAVTGTSPLAPTRPATGQAPGNPTALATAEQLAAPGVRLAAPHAAETPLALSTEPFTPALRLAPSFGPAAARPDGVVRASLRLPVAPSVAVVSYAVTPAAAVTAPPLKTAVATPDRGRQTAARSGQARTQRQLPRLPAGQADDAESVARIVLERTVEGMLRDRLGQN